jgi:hypothetical protein
MAGSRVCLNFNRTWAEVGNIVTSTDKSGKPNGWVKEAFRGGVADKVLLKAGTRLYKFNNMATLVDMAWLGASQGITVQGSVVISPWWSAYEPFTHVWSKQSGFRGCTDDPGWMARKSMAARFGISIREWGRITSVVKENWNSLQYLMVITLKHDAYGWFGGFASMGRQDANSTSKRFGNEARLGAGAKPVSYTSAGMKDRIAKFGAGGTLAGGATQFYIPNVRMINVASWNVEDLSAI